MKFKKYIQKLIRSVIYRIPNIYFTFYSLKIFEFKELIKNVQLSSSDIILDLGCGDGLLTILIGKKCKKIYGIDINKKSLLTAKIRSNYSKIKNKLNFILGDIRNIGFKSNYFDKIFSFCVLEHILNFNDILKETFRILKSRGELYLSVDSLDLLKNKSIIDTHKKKYYVENYFRKESLKKNLLQIGFKKVYIYPIFKSNYAEKLFLKNIFNEFKFNNFFFVFQYIILKLNELSNKDNKKGLVLIAKCYK